jgi:hypothetical protein
MSVFGVDETIRVRKLPSGPVRQLQPQFAPVRRERWPWIVVAICFLGGLAIADPIELSTAGGPAQAQRSADAEELLRLLGR